MLQILISHIKHSNHCNAHNFRTKKKKQPLDTLLSKVQWANKICGITHSLVAEPNGPTPILTHRATEYTLEGG